MSLSEDRERFESEDEYEGCAEREAQEAAEWLRDDLEEFAAAARKLGEKLRSRRVSEQWKPGAANAIGFQPGYRITNEAMDAQIRADALGVFTPWLREDVRALVEE